MDPHATVDVTVLFNWLMGTLLAALGFCLWALVKTLVLEARTRRRLKSVEEKTDKIEQTLSRLLTQDDSLKKVRAIEIDESELLPNARARWEKIKKEHPGAIFRAQPDGLIRVFRFGEPDEVFPND